MSPAASSVKLTSVTEAFSEAPKKDRKAGVDASARVWDSAAVCGGVIGGLEDLGRMDLENLIPSNRDV